MKKLVYLAAALIVMSYGAVSKADMTGSYGLHLYFDEKEFVDVLNITTGPSGELSGDMIVPSDFNGKLLNIKADERQLSFDLVVPKNPSRPNELVFSYRLLFFDTHHDQFVGFVTLRGQKDFIGSFVGFKRTAAKQ